MLFYFLYDTNSLSGSSAWSYDRLSEESRGSTGTEAPGTLGALETVSYSRPDLCVTTKCYLFRVLGPVLT